MKKLAVLLISALCGCASTSGVVAMGADVFMVSRSEKAFDATGSRVKAVAIREANEFCAAKGKTIEIVKATQNDMVAFKSDAQAEVEFRCVTAK